MIKRLAGCVREYKKQTFLAPLLVILECAVDILIPTLMAALIDKGIDVGDMANIWKYGLLMLLCVLTGIALGIAGGRISAVASAGFAKNLRHDIFYRVQTFSFANIDKFSTGSIVTRLTTDVSRVQMAFMMTIRMAVRSPFNLIFALIMALRIHVGLALIFLAAIPLLGFGLGIISVKVHPHFRRAFEVYDRMNTVVQEDLRGIRVVKSFVREEYEESKFNKVAGEMYNAFCKAEKLLALNSPIMQTAMYSCTLLVAWFGARIIVGSGSADLTTGELTSLISYATQVLMSLMMLSMVFVMIIMSRASMQRVYEILIEESDLQNGENPVTEVPDGSVRFENVSFSYAKDENRLCLFDVDLDIRSGETIGILGGTGSSKSTLVQLIPRLYDTTLGRVLVGGKDVREYDMAALRDQVAMVLQKNDLFSGTVKENLRWGNENATDEELIHACELAQADGFIREFPDGYDTYIEQGGSNVSGGQKQRLCIARALLKKPKILILDDSTSAVDTQTDAMIRKAFREYIPDTTKFIIAQRVASVEDADRILILDNGHVDAFDTPEALLASNAIYREIYYSQVKGGRSDG